MQLCFVLSKASERSERALGSTERCGRMFPIDSEMAGRIGLKLGGMVEDMGENDLAKEFFGSVDVDRGQVSGPQVPLLLRGAEVEGPAIMSAILRACIFVSFIYLIGVLSDVQPFLSLRSMVVAP